MGRLSFTMVAASLGAVAVVVAGCGSSSSSSSTASPPSTSETGTGGGTVNRSVSGHLSVMASWTGAEQKSFQAVLRAFRTRYPNVSVSYRSGGDQLPTVLSTAVAGGHPPDIAALPQPGLMTQFAGRGALKPISFVRSTLEKNYAPVWLSLGSVNGKLYGFVFKAANKSTVWYNVASFQAAGVEPPKTWNDLLQTANTLQASGTNAYSIGGADGWTLTDLFENIYLRQAGEQKYDALTKHTIRWTDPSVVAALHTMTDILGAGGNLAGGTKGALQTDFPTSVVNVFQRNSKAAMVFEGDFVAGNISSDFPDLQPVTGYDEFPFPSIGGSSGMVVGGGDTMVMFRNSAAARALISYLATPDAARVWAMRGGFSSPNRKLSPDVYPDELTRRMATALATAKVFRFDMSDLQPASFGGTVAQGEYRDFQTLLRKPGDVMGVARQLEIDAARAYARQD